MKKQYTIEDIERSSKDYEVVSVEANKNNIVKKHQELVHHARYKLSELGVKVLSVLISMIKVSDHEFTQYGVKIGDFKELIGSDSKNTYKYTHKLISELMSNPMKLGDEQFNWVSYAKYEKGSNLVVFEVHRLLKPYLLELKNNFLQYNITNILPLKSTYVIRMYEVCKDHWNEGTRYKKDRTSVKFDLSIDRMREQFGIPKSYLYKDIRVNIIDKAVNQFAEKTDLKISYVEQKIGRKVDRIIITVRENSKGSNDLLASQKAFISYMRMKHVNDDVLLGEDKNTGKKIMISISPDGKLYDKYGSNFDSKRSAEIWENLYNLAQDKKLYCLKQGSLF